MTATAPQLGTEAAVAAPRPLGPIAVPSSSATGDLNRLHEAIVDHAGVDYTGAAPQTRQRPVYQPSLFRDSSIKVVPIPVMPSARPQVHHAIKPSHPKPVTKHARKHRAANENQQKLDLREYATGGLGLESLIICDDPVAQPEHRMIACLVDTGIVTVSVIAFLAIFHFMAIGIANSEMWQSIAGNAPMPGVGLGLDMRSVGIGLGAALALSMLYRFFWGMLETDTPGMHFAGLRLTNFDGRTPTRRQRMIRHSAYLVSLVSAGLGFLWAWMDEESLTWHDHISGTFPTHRDELETDLA
jgi:uncharacterized RDD family membrane protein YckC